MALFKPEQVLDILPNNYYVIDINSLLIVESNNLGAGKGKSTCYQFLFGYSEPCFKKGYNCICLQTKELKTPLELTENLPEHPGGKNMKVHAKPVFNENNEVAFCVAEYIDITESPNQKSLQQEIEAKRALTEEYITTNEELIKTHAQVTESEARFRALFENSGTANAYFSTDGRLILQNALSSKFFGGNEGKYVGNLLPEIFGKKAGAEILEKFREVIVAKEKVSFQPFIEFSGQNYWLIIHLVPVFDSCGKLSGVQTITEDITGLKNAEINLHASEGKYKRLVENSPDIIYISSLKKGLLYFSPGVKSISGIEASQFISDTTKWLQSVLPEDIHVINKINHSIKNQTNYDFEYRIYDTQKNIHWLRDRSFSIKPEGSDFIVEGILSDITFRKNTERQLKESQLRYKKLFENIDSGIIVYRSTGSDFEIINLNKAVESIFRIIKEGAKGRLANEVFPNLKDTGLFAALKKVDSTGNPIYLPAYSYKGQGFDLWIENYLYKLPNNDIITIYRDLTNEINQQKELKINQKRLLRAEKLAKTGNWEFNLTTNTTSVSEGAMSIYGIENRTYKIIEIQQKPLPQYRKMLDEALSRLINEGIPYDVVFEINTPTEGKTKWIHSIAEYSKNKNLVFGTINDITELKKSQRELQLKNKMFLSINEELENNLEKLQEMNTELEEEKEKVEESRKFLQSVINHSPVITLLLDRNANIINTNRYGLDFIGKKFQDIAGFGCGTLINCANTLNNPEGCGKSSSCKFCGINKAIQETLNSGVEKYKEECEVTGFLPSGEKQIATFLVSTSLFKRQGEVILLLALDDITKRKEMEASLIEAKLKAQESDRLKTAFLANMSHEIRTPLNGLLGFTNIICSENYPPEQLKEYRRIVENCGSRLLTVVNDILDISMLQANQIKIHYEKVKIGELLDELFILYGKSYSEKTEIKLTLSEHHKQYCNIEIETDKNRLFQIFKNLLDNAFKFTSKGEIKFGCNPYNDGFITFFVKDTGIGISNDKLESIFEPFRQADESWSKHFGGTGLGLSIASQLVSRLGGKIWAETELGKGSAFYFTLPAINYSANPHKKMPETTNDLLPLLRGKKIAIVEDDYESFLYIRSIFEKWQTQCIYFEKAEDFIGFIKENDADIILMDARLPGEGGYEAVKISKQLKPAVPVIMQMADAMQGGRQKALESGCDDYISKPVDQELLTKKIRALILNHKN